MGYKNFQRIIDKKLHNWALYTSISVVVQMKASKDMCSLSSSTTELYVCLPSERAT